MNMKQKITEIIKELQDVCRNSKLEDVEDCQLLEQAVKIYLSEEINKSKKENIAEMKKTNLKSTANPQEKATEKQLAYLERLGYEGKIDKLSKEEAKILIKERLENE